MDAIRKPDGKLVIKEPNRDKFPEAAAAWGKAQAIYGKIEPTDDVASLMNTGDLMKRLGTSILISESKVGSATTARGLCY